MNTLSAYASKESNRKTLYNSGDKVRIKDVDGKIIEGELHYNGWSIYEINGTNKITDINDTAIERKNITMTLLDEPKSTVSSFFNGLSWSRGGKRSRRKSRRSHKSRKYIK